MIRKVIEKIFLKNIKNSDIEREQWVRSILESLPKGNLLDCGAGECKYKDSCSHLNYVSQDFCQFDGNAIAGLDKNGKWNTSKIDIVSDITNIPVDDQSFDYILCSEVLEHIKYPHLAIKEFSRIIKKNGTIILTAPFMSFTHFAPYHYCSGFDKYWYEEVLKDFGFKLKKIVASGNYFDLLSQDLLRGITVADKYSKRFNVIQNFILALMIRILNGKSKNDFGSSEFGCFHYFVIAEKM